MNKVGLFILALTLPLSLASQTTVTLGNTSSSVNTSKYPFYGDYDNSWSTALYTASEIGYSGTITKVAFDVVNSPSNYTMNNQKVYVRHTSTTSYADGYYPGTTAYTLVYSGSITYNGSGWKEIVFDTPFQYNGTDNLAFLFENRDGSYASGSPSFRYTASQSNYLVKRDYMDGSFPVACLNCERFQNKLNIKITFDCTGVLAGNASITNATDCNDNNFNLNLTSYIGSIQWQSSTDFVNYSDISGATSASYSASPAGNIWYRAKVTGSCTKYSNVISHGNKFYVNDNNQAGDVYSSSTGNDANSGLSPSTPKASISSVINTYALTACDIVYVDAGSYSDAVTFTSADKGSVLGYVSVLGAGSAKTTLSATTGNNTIKLSSTSYVNIQEMKLVNNDTTKRPVRIEYSSDNVISNCNIQQTNLECISVIGKHNLTEEGAHRNKIQYNTINNNFSHGRGIVVTGNCDRTQITDNNIICSGTGTDAYGIMFQMILSDGLYYFPDTAKIYTNNITAEKIGIVILGTNSTYKLSNFEIKGNTVTVNSSSLWYGGPLYLANAGTSSSSNIIHSNRLKGGKNGVFIDENVKYMNFRNNYIYGSETGMYVYHFDSDQNNLYFNSFYNSVRNVYFSDETTTDQTYDNWNLKNNIFYLTASSGSCLQIDDAGDKFLSIDYNIFYAPNGANLTKYGTTNYSTITSWRAIDHSKEGTLNGDENSLSGNPSYVGPETGNLDLPGTSIALGEGVSISGITTDIYETTRFSPPSIGAEEAGFGIKILVYAGAAQSICSGTSVMLGDMPLASGGTPAYTYSWAPSTGLSSTTVANPTASPSTTTSYTVIVTDSQNRSQAGVVAITVYSALTLNAGNTQTICPGSVANLGGSPTATGGASPYSYLWIPSDSLDADTIANPTAFPLVTTGYQLRVVDNNGCIKTASVIVNVKPTAVVNAGEDKTILVGDSIVLGTSPIASGGTSPYTYSWTPSTGLNSTTVANPKAVPSNTTTYVVSINDAGACAAVKDTVIVTVDLALKVSAGVDIPICRYDTTSIGGFPTARGGTSPYTYNWSPSTGLSSTTASNPFANPTTTTTYVVAVTDASSTVKRDTVIVKVNSLPIANAGPRDTTVEAGGYVLGAFPTASGGKAPYNYNWFPETSSASSNPYISVFQNADYIVMVSDSNGCNAHDTVSITVTHNAGSFCNLDSCTWSITGTDNNNYTVGSGQKLCIYYSGKAYGNITVNTGGVICNSGLIQPSGITFNGGTINNNSEGTISITTGDLTCPSGSKLFNDGLLKISGKLICQKNSTFSNQGKTEPMGEVKVKTALFYNYGVITSNIKNFVIDDSAAVYNHDVIRAVDSLKNSGTIYVGHYALAFAKNMFNYSTGKIKKITGDTLLGGFIVCNRTENHGNINDSVDVCDKTPPGSAPYLDQNTGTIQSTVSYCTKPIITSNSGEACGNCASITLIKNGCAGEKIIFTATSSKAYDNYEFFKNGVSVQSSFDSVYAMDTAAVNGHTYYVVGSTLKRACISVLSNTLTVTNPPTVSISVDSTSVADSVIFTASGASSYNWSTVANGGLVGTASQLRVSPASTTTYKVEGTNSSACIGTATVTVVKALSVNYSVQAPTFYAPISGVISTTVLGGKTPYTYSWNTGANTPFLTGLGKGSYHVTVIDANLTKIEKDITVGSAADWMNSIGVTASGASITKTATGNGWGTSGTVSADILNPGQDGWVEFKANTLNTSYMFGLGTGNNNGNYTGINYAFSVESNALKIYENGTLKTTVSGALAGDVLQVQRLGSTINYRKNGTIVYSSSTDPSLSLMVNAALYSSGTTIQNIQGDFSGYSDAMQYTLIQGPGLAKCTNDANKNFVHTTYFDENLNVISESKIYSDYQGRQTQTQTRSIADNMVIASQTIYDAYGRPALQTLPAPTGLTFICYKNNFIANTAQQAYSIADFDVPNNTWSPNVIAYGEVDRPKQVGNGSGTVGGYYSNNNTVEPYIPASSFPYVRTEYSNENLSTPRRTSMAGESLKMGSGHESQAYQMAAADELKYLYGNGTTGTWIVQNYTDNNHDGQGTITGSALNYTNKYTHITKTISIDENGHEAVVFQDANGRTLVSCLSGQENGSNVNTFTNITRSVSKDLFADVHLPEGCQSSLTITNSNYYTPTAATYNILNLKTGKFVKFGNGIDFTGTQPNLPSGIYRIYFKSSTVPFGNIITTQTVNYYNFTLYYYDKAGRLRLVVAPAGVAYTTDFENNPPPAHKMISSYEYNTLGWTIASITPNEGRTELMYRKDGSLRFSQNAKQRASSGTANLRRFSYVNYDQTGRVIETGEYDPQISAGGSAYYFDFLQQNGSSPSTTSILESTSASGSNLDAARCTQQSYIMYDIPDPDFYTLTGLSSSYKQEFMLGQISRTYNAAGKTWYSYDELGRVTWTVQRVEDMPYAGNHAIKTLNYTYDFNGNVTQVTYQKELSGERFFHYYEYDADKRLKKVYTSTVEDVNKTEQASYSYYKHGPLKRVELAGKLQGLDYIYTINGWLKSMNSPELNDRDPGKDGTANSPNHVPKDLFGMSLDYHTDDYLRAGTYVQTANTGALYNGIIKNMRWQTALPANASGLSYTNTELMYSYTYDKKYQLTSSIFGNVTSNGTMNAPFSRYNNYTKFPQYLGPQQASTDDYKVSGITYDLNGNITALNRNAWSAGPGGQNMDQLTYNYHAAGINNKLKNVPDAVSSTAYTDKGFTPGQSSGTANYVYNEIGELTQDISNSNYYNYDVYGQVTEIYSNPEKTDLRARFTYDASGQRIKKATPTVDETWYIRDAGGNVISVYNKPNTGDPVQTELGIFGTGRLGLLNRLIGDKYVYELNDHLGNVRATFGITSANISTSFEGNGTDDYLFDFYAVDNTLGRTGSKSALTNSANTIAFSSAFPIKKNETVTVQFYYRTSTGNPLSKTSIYILNSTPSGGTQDFRILPLSSSSLNAWTTASLSLQASGDGNILVYAVNDDNQTVWFDDVSITLGNGGGIKKLDILSLNDYYPHGSIMPGRNFAGNSYRYDYQGQEKDAETKLNAFELRQWDGLLGRWSSTDPYGQYHSPYLGMGNNPVNMIDPDGGFDLNAGLTFGIIGAGAGGLYAVLAHKDDPWIYVVAGAALGFLGGGTFYEVDFNKVELFKYNGWNSNAVAVFTDQSPFTTTWNSDGSRTASIDFTARGKIKVRYDHNILPFGNITRVNYNGRTKSSSNWNNPVTPGKGSFTMRGNGTQNGSIDVKSVPPRSDTWNNPAQLPFDEWNVSIYQQQKKSFSIPLPTIRRKRGNETYSLKKTKLCPTPK